MHGATLLDKHDRALRPAILWNDGRSALQCAQLEAAVPSMTEITGNRAMPGFTAPKLLWVREHEPKVFADTAMVLLPKDYVRLRMTGETASDMSDSAGTLWLDVANRRWSETMLAGTGLDVSNMPSLAEGWLQSYLASAGTADARLPSAQRENHRRSRASHKAWLFVRVRSRDGRADLPDRIQEIPRQLGSRRGHE